MSKKRTVSISYTSREFDSIKADLLSYVKRYYPNTFRDFNEASFGSLMIDTVAYIGDILSFYIDYQANETFLETAAEYENILKIGKQLGFKLRSSPPSVGTAAFYIMIPALTSGLGPDLNYLPILKRSSSFGSRAGSNFILNEDVHFGRENNEIRVARVNESTGKPTYYAVKAYGQVMSGVLEREFIELEEFVKFRRVELQAPDVSEIISITDSEGNEFYEVDHLSQNVIYKGVTNRSKTLGNQSLSYNTGDQAAEILKPFVVPRRFITELDGRTTKITFGASSDVFLPKDMISEPQSTVLQTHGRNYIQDKAFDPTKLIESDKFGVGPFNTILTIDYRTNSEDNINCRVGQLTDSINYVLEFEDVVSLDSAKLAFVNNSLEVDNEEPIVGNVAYPDSYEIKHRIRGSYASQNRAVTQQDYESLIYQMPQKFGALKRCRILRDNDSLKRNLNLYVIAEGASGELAPANEVLKKNVKTWIQKNKMMNDTIDIFDAKILNLEINFTAVGELGKPKFETLELAKQRLVEYFERMPDIGEPIFVTDVYRELREVDGIIDVTDVEINQKVGTDGSRDYSTIRFDVEKAKSPDGRYIEIPKNVIYEIKFPTFDIKGVIV